MKKQIKKIMICIMAAVLVFTAMPMNSLAAEPTIVESGKCGENVTYTLDSDGLLTISGEGAICDFSSTYHLNHSVKAVVINNGVTSICEWAFYDCTDLTKIIIPDSVTSIGNYAFNYCTGLTSVTIPDSITSIGNWAFERCTGLTSIIIPDSVTSIGDRAFEDCTGLTSVTIPDSVTHIGDCAFCSCTGLTNITVDNNNKAYDSRKNCNAIIETATNTLICGCKNTVIPDSVTSIGEDAFGGCTGLTSITIPDSVTNIGDYAFSCCTGLTSLTIPDSVTSIGDGAFSVCIGLTNITIPNSVTSIGNWAFERCTGLTSVTIPDSITSIGNYTFYGCERLSNIIIPDSVTNIGENAFRGCTGLTSITIPDSVTRIEHFAFSNCTGLKEINFGTELDYIGYGAFKNCTGLSKIKLPEKVKTIGASAFSECTNLLEVDIPSSVVSIGEIRYPYGDSAGIDDATFTGCAKLLSINVDQNNPSYSSLEGVLFNKDMTCLIEYPGGKSEKYIVPDAVKSIQEFAFKGHSEITEIVLPSSLEEICWCTFYGCDNLKQITIPYSVISISTYAFWICESLTDVYYTGSAEQWEKIYKGHGNDCLLSANIHYNWFPCEESNITVNGKDYSVVMDYGDAFSGDVELNISKADSGNFEIPLNPFLSLNINAVSDGKEVQPDKPVTLMFEKSMFNCGVDELTIFHFPDGKTPETFNNRKTDSAYHITEKTLDGNTYYCITISSLSPFIFTDGTGDVNSDGTVNSSDALTVLQHSVGQITLEGSDFANGDVTKDNVVNSSDALKILQFSVGQINTF